MRRFMLVAIVIGAAGACTKNSTSSPTPQPTCTYTLSTATQSPAASGGESTVTVTRTQGSCTWTAASDSSWISLSSTTGSDTAVVTLTVAPNTSTDARTGRITVSWTGGTVQLTVTQAGVPPGCTYTVNPTAVTIPVAGDSGTSTVSVTGLNCSWSAQSNQFWIHVTSGSSGTATGTIAYTVDANTGVQRFGRIIVTHTLGTTDISFTQDGAPCSASLNPATQAAGFLGGSFSTALTTACQWTAASDSPWLSISSASSGTGNASIAYSVAANTAATPRAGHITITAGTATAQLTVNQDPASLAANFTVSASPCAVAPTGSGSNQLSCTFDGSSSIGTITNYEFRLVGASGPVLGTTAVVANPTVPCGQGGLTGTGDVLIDVVLTITGPSGSATRVMSVTFRRNAGC